MDPETVEQMPFTAPPPPQQPATPAQDQLTLKFRDMNGFSIDFKLKPITKLGKAMTAFSARLQKDTKELRFLSEGRRVLPDQTPSDLELEDGDEIDVHMEQIGGHMI
ncbi:hypothetical protein KC318_g18158 [Hortaea werneckii]|uniref:Ubiquitin-like domain-containing protein n=1 Tax=Hortaea werneckii TaxID=91943 RepID=A0A3M7AMI4_HORWE|nr:hypothetical protein KC334_g17098 [Hortaea werneckii]KAI7007087.1 hypothetical protein KC355_g7461 [Hortaea werneckii]KAI7648118.1 hypothetical protein KC318_g18158 [Hortaea werneckii]RMX82479.1 hypothetical protein D0867_16184 [Hortaea werneckii]RMY28460.1 hypothetical protein D0866_09404 [Hortaea werneckii]